MNGYTIVIPKYPGKVQISASRHAKYYTSLKDIPKKYQIRQYVMKNGKLYDTKNKKFVIRNEISRHKPRYVTIAGNNLYSGMHERVRMKIIYELKKAMRPHLPDKPLSELTGLPVKVTMHVYRTVENGGWDLDNFNIFYFKAFFDLLRDEGVLPEDNIQYIVAVGSEFHPITNDDERRLEFVFEQATGSHIKGHLLYQDKPTEFLTGTCEWKIKISKELETGRLMIDYDTKTYYINIGKRYVIWNAVKKVLTSIAVHALVISKPVMVSQTFYEMFANQLREIMFSHHIPVYVENIQEDKWVLELYNKTKINKNGRTGIRNNRTE